jgi:hypothetical protein
LKYLPISHKFSHAISHTFSHIHLPAVSESGSSEGDAAELFQCENSGAVFSFFLAAAGTEPVTGSNDPSTQTREGCRVEVDTPAAVTADNVTLENLHVLVLDDSLINVKVCAVYDALFS